MDESLPAFFQKHHLKMTDARCAIVGVLKEAKAPMSYEQMKGLLCEPMDKATFYRNVAKFEDLGIVSKFESDDRKWYFELTTSTHAHFICEMCHQITCMNVDLGVLEGEVKSIVLKGRCKECQR
jgi:Fur family ferric uptake transcriptional regulator